jgi:hypothetical protein
MRKSIVTALLIIGSAAVAAALPTGLSGLTVGFGGHFGDVDQGRIGTGFDFSLPPYVSLGPELMLGFGDNATLLLLGAETRVYFIPNYRYIIQPHMFAGGGYGHAFWEGDDENGGYLHFGGGMDFEIPAAPMAPYFDMGGLILIGGDDTLGEFSIEGGLRFNLW